MWYYLDYNPEPKIFKVTEQTKMLHGEAIEVKDRLCDIHYDEDLQQEHIIIDYVEIKAKSLFTDILWDHLFHGNIKIISEDSWEIIKESNLLNIKNYLTLVQKKDVVKRYHSLRGFGEIYQWIDFNKSIFSWYKSKTKERENVKFDTHGEYREFSRKVGPIDTVNPIEIYFKSEFINHEYDLIPMGYLKPCSFLISNKLKAELVKQGLIGYEFNECSYIKN